MYLVIQMFDPYDKEVTEHATKELAYEHYKEVTASEYSDAIVYIAEVLDVRE